MAKAREMVGPALQSTPKIGGKSLSVRMGQSYTKPPTL